MSLVSQLAGLALKGAAQAAGQASGIAVVGVGVERTVEFLTQRFKDNSAKLDAALSVAVAQSWRAVEVALAGRGWWDRCKLLLATGDERAIRERVNAFLTANPLNGLDGHGPDFRGQCLAQLQSARKAGLLDHTKSDPTELARRVGDLSLFGDPTSRVEAEFNALGEVAAGLRRRGYEALAAFLSLRPASGSPLLASAARYFFQRELEKDQQLFHGLAYAQLEDLAAGQRAGFGGLAETLEQHGARMESLLGEVQAVVVRTHADVLDIKAEMARQGAQLRDLGDAVVNALAQHQLERRALSGGDSLSIRDEEERRLVRDLVKRYRALPAEERRQLPALLNAVGKLEVVTGYFEAAERDFREVARLVPDHVARAEAAHNAYLAALELRNWSDALASLNESVALDPARFAPFPAEKYEAERILGAGGFGVALLCRNRHSGGRVVIKSLRRDQLDRDLNDVFREAQALEDLDHPAIIRVRDCDFADAGRSRPYLVMDYFSGTPLSEYVEQHGPLSPDDLVAMARQVAEGLYRAHGKSILHRDVKPGNLLVKRSDGAKRWDVKLIDFGLALRATPTGSTAKASMDKTLIGSSLAGTLDYAAPEQLGKVKGIAVGPYSDVYGFGKLCCFALFATASPTYHHWKRLPPALADLLGRCLAEKPGERPQDFGALLKELEGVLTANPDCRRETVTTMENRQVQILPKTVEPPRAKPAEATSGNWPTLLGVGAVVALILGGVMWQKGSRNITPPPLPIVVPNVAGVTKNPPTAIPIPRPDNWPLKNLLADLTTLAKQQELADYLVKHPPTTTQWEKHRELKVKESLKDGGPDKWMLEKVRNNDDITQVSAALNILLRSNQPATKQAAVTAAKNWGTMENLKELEKLTTGGTTSGNPLKSLAEEAIRVIKARPR